MYPQRFFRLFVVAVCLSTAATALANGHHHSGGGGSAESEGPCIRWEKLDAGASFDPNGAIDSDASVDDGGRVVAMPSLDAGVDADASDAASDAAADAAHDAGASPPPAISDSHAGERCVEHAGLSACSVRGVGDVDAPTGVLALVTLVFAMLVARRRRAEQERA